MIYSRWATKDEIEERLNVKRIGKDDSVQVSGIPVGYDDNSILVSQNEEHSLVIATIGSGKTQTIILPKLELVKRAGESVVVLDSNNELYAETSTKFKESGYNILKLDFSSTTDSAGWNPFALAEKLYNDKDLDNCIDCLNEIGYYLFSSKIKSDPFWSDSATSYLSGICLYLLENNLELNFKNINELSNKIELSRKNFFEKLDKNGIIYMMLAPILAAPTETYGSIISIYKQRMNNILTKPNLTKMLSGSSLDLTKLKSEKTVVYIMSASDEFSARIMSLFIDQIYHTSLKYSKLDIKLNIILDDFYYLYPIKDFARLLSTSRSINLSFIIFINGLNELYNRYGSEEAEIIKMNITNIIYLMSKDMPTLKKISDDCGNTQDGSLISVNELKTLDYFEAIILTTRCYPIRTKLLPYYKLNK